MKFRSHNLATRSSTYSTTVQFLFALHKVLRYWVISWHVSKSYSQNYCVIIKSKQSWRQQQSNSWKLSARGRDELTPLNNELSPDTSLYVDFPSFILFNFVLICGRVRDMREGHKRWTSFNSTLWTLLLNLHKYDWNFFRRHSVSSSVQCLFLPLFKPEIKRNVGIRLLLDQGY